ncbi:MAG: lipopolysaccharide biosynthesis protein [Rhodobacterales bacterium]
MTFSTEPIDTSRKSVSRGALYVGVAQAWRMGLSFVSAIVFARLLLPSDFGLVAMVAPVVAFAALIQDLGLSQATVQRETVTQQLLGALFWLNVCAGAVLSLALIALAPALAAFYDQPQVITLATAFSAVIFLTSLQNQHLAIMTRRMEFLRISVIEATAASLGFIAGLIVAFIYASYWALLAASLVTALSSTIMFWTLSGWRPGHSSFGGAFKEIAGFSSGLTGHALFTYLARNLDDVLIGRYHGAEALGFYDRAYKLLLLPLNQISTPLGRVMIPLMSRLRSERDRYVSVYLEASTYLMIVTQPTIVILIVFADEVFLVLLGERWVVAAPIFQVLGICGLQQVFTNTFFWLFVSQGRAKELFQLSVLRAIIACGAFVIGLPWGALGVATAYAISDIFLRMPMQVMVLTRNGPLSLRVLTGSLLPHLAATIATAAAALAVAHMVTLTAWIFILTVVLCNLVYLGCLALFPNKRTILYNAVRRVLVKG